MADKENTLVDLVRNAREGGQSVVGSLGTGIKERLKEKLDPRQFFNQKGLMTALFPSLKSYKSGITSGDALTPVKSTPAALEKATKDTEILAKNMMVLPAVHKDFNLMRQNMVKMIKLMGGKPATKVDKDFFSSKQRSAAYGVQTAPTPVDDDKKEKTGFDILKIMAGIALLGVGLKLSFEYIGDKIKESISDSLKDIPGKILTEIKELFTKPKKDEILDLTGDITDYLQEDGYKKLLSPDMYEKLSKGAEQGATYGEEEDYASTNPVPANVPSLTPTQVPKLTKNQSEMQDRVYKAWLTAGFSANQAKALTAEVGRENGYQEKYVFGQHAETANNSSHGRANLGFMSWAGPRRTQLLDYLRGLNLTYKTKDDKGNEVELIKPSQEALNAMAMFARKEIETNPQYKETKDKFLANPNVDRDTAAKVLGTNYIGWRYNDPAYAQHHERRNAYSAQIDAKLKTSPELLRPDSSAGAGRGSVNPTFVAPTPVRGAAVDAGSTELQQTRKEVANGPETVQVPVPIPGSKPNRQQTNKVQQSEDVHEQLLRNQLSDAW